MNQTLKLTRLESTISTYLMKGYGFITGELRSWLFQSQVESQLAIARETSESIIIKFKYRHVSRHIAEMETKFQTNSA